MRNNQAFWKMLRTTFASPHKTIASMGLTLNFRSNTIAAAKNRIICTHTFWRKKFTVPSMKKEEIKMVTPALAIIATTAGRREDNVPCRSDRFRYFM